MHLRYEEGERRLSYSDLARSLSFGHNAADDVNTCTAISVGLALNLLARVQDESIMEKNMMAEPLISSLWAPEAYPNTLRLQRSLIDECGLSPRYLFGGFTFGVWGRKAARGVARFCALHSPRNIVRLKPCIGPGMPKRLRQSIDEDLPVLISTGWSTFNGGRFNTHTMLVYGYRISAGGACEYLVHPGWYGNAWIEGGTWRIKEVWAPASLALVGYTVRTRQL